MADVLVTGGTGTLGRVLVPRLVAAGHAVAVLSRHEGPDVGGAARRTGDLATGQGVAQALHGADVVVHLASDPLHARRTDVQGTDRLVAAARAAGVRHLVFLSIVGCDRNPYPFYRAKAEVEERLLDGPLPASVLRATQFHDFVPQLASMLLRGPLMPLPKGFRSQLVDLRDVSDRLVEAVAGEPRGRLRDLAGPDVVDAREALTRWCEAVGRRPPRFLTLPAVGGVLRAFAEGTNLAGPDADRGTRSYETWLEELRRGSAP
ncbi:NAD(P)H-binding protein [Angustibacter peucedani]